MGGTTLAPSLERVPSLDELLRQSSLDSTVVPTEALQGAVPVEDVTYDYNDSTLPELQDNIYSLRLVQLTPDKEEIVPNNLGLISDAFFQDLIEVLLAHLWEKLELMMLKAD